VKRLLLFRHAKAVPHVLPGGPLEDHDRTLAPRGKREAKAMGRFLALTHQAPDEVACSTAERCRATVTLAARAGHWKTTVRFADDLYGGAPSAYLAVLREAADEHAVAMLCGHEPTLSELASLLVGGGSLRLPPGSVVAIDFAVERWRDVALGDGQLVYLLPPRLLTEGEVELGR
jgi:phosphohistidine phosphatase